MTVEREKLARFEEKLDSIKEMVTKLATKDTDNDKRIKDLEIKVAVIMTVGGGLWAVVLILISMLFKKIFGW